MEQISDWLLSQLGENIQPTEIAIVGRTEAQLARARDAVRKASDITGRGLGGIRLATMHNAKGLEFRCVCVMACDDDVIPLEDRIRAIGDHADLEELCNTDEVAGAKAARVWRPTMSVAKILLMAARRSSDVTETKSSNGGMRSLHV